MYIHTYIYIYVYLYVYVYVYVYMATTVFERQFDGQNLRVFEL